METETVTVVETEMEMATVVEMEMEMVMVMVMVDLVQFTELQEMVIDRNLYFNNTINSCVFQNVKSFNFL